MSNSRNLAVVERPIASVVILSADGKILLGKKHPSSGGVYPNAWHIPGGGVEPGETASQAACREVFEETGIRLQQNNLRALPGGHGEAEKTLADGTTVWCVMSFHRFETRLTQSAAKVVLREGDDLVQLTWFTREKLGQLDLVPGTPGLFVGEGYMGEL